MASTSEREVQRQKEVIETLELKLRDSTTLIQQLQDQLATATEKANGKDQDDAAPSDEEKLSVTYKVSKFNRTRPYNRNRIEHTIAALNSVYAFQHMSYSNDVDAKWVIFKPSQSSPHELAAKLAYGYSLEFGQQIYVKMTREEFRSQLEEYPFPIKWLISVFPVINDTNEIDEQILNDDDGIWLPVHFTAAIDTSKLNSAGKKEYISNLTLIMKEYGLSSLLEEVSPMSIAVSKKNPDLEVIQSMVKWKEDMVSQRDADGTLPLMHAASYNEDDKVIKYFLSLYPEALKMKDNFNCYAIHYACFYGSLPGVKALLESDPALAYLEEGNGALPLHDAVQNKSVYNKENWKVELIQLLLSYNPHAPRKADASGALPLHNAAKYADIEIVKLIHAKFPLAIFLADNEGLLPIHYYSERDDKTASIDVINYLLEHNSASKVVESDNDHYKKSIEDEEEAKKAEEEKQSTSNKSFNFSNFFGSIKSSVKSSPVRNNSVTTDRASYSDSYPSSESANVTFDMEVNSNPLATGGSKIPFPMKVEEEVSMGDVYKNDDMEEYNSSVGIGDQATSNIHQHSPALKKFNRRKSTLVGTNNIHKLRRRTIVKNAISKK